MEFRLVIGLGNSEPAYARTYHNAGFLFIDALARLQGAPTDLPRNRLLKTSTAMNASGAFVERTIRKLSAAPATLLVAHDDADLALGTYRCSFGRGAAGHKGVADIIAKLNTKGFWRLRIGVRRAPPAQSAPRVRAGEFVLAPISPEDMPVLLRALEEAARDIARRFRA